MRRGEKRQQGFRLEGGTGGGWRGVGGVLRTGGLLLGRDVQERKFVKSISHIFLLIDFIIAYHRLCRVYKKSRSGS